MNGFITVFGLDTHESLTFQAKTPYEAMTKLLYTLNLKHKDKFAKIENTNSNLHLYTIHNGKTYAVRM